MAVQFPLGPNQRVSTSFVGQYLFSQSVKQVDRPLADAIAGEGQWRKHYGRHLLAYQQAASENVTAAQLMASEGLSQAHQVFQFETPFGRESLRDVMQKALLDGGRFRVATAHIKGQAPEVNKAYLSQVLGSSLDSFQARLKQWVQQGVVEASHYDDVANLLKHPQRLNLKGQVFVVLGATSEVGPLRTLLALGATVYAVSRPSAERWSALIDFARSTPGCLKIPCKGIEQARVKQADDHQVAQWAGLDLLEDTPEIAPWLLEIPEPFTLGCYAYLHGEAHVRVVMAMDAVTDAVLSRRHDVSLAYLLTPSDLYTVKQDIIDANQATRQWGFIAKSLRRSIKCLSLGRWFSHNIVLEGTDNQGDAYGVLDNLVPQQGPNYVLAKRIQRWRAIEASRQGVAVSCNVAPAASTQSVMTRPLFLAASMGAEAFGVKVFSPKDVNLVMTLQMLHDVKSGTIREQGENLFLRGANHGGAWRMGFQFRSLLLLSVAAGFYRKWFKRRTDSTGSLYSDISAS